MIATNKGNNKGKGGMGGITMDGMDINYLNFILRVQKEIPANSPILVALRCNSLLKCKALQENGEVKVPNKLFSPMFRCSVCGTEWKEGAFSTRVVPKKFRPGKRVKRLIKKGEESYESLRKYERGLFKRCQKTNGNQLVLRCLICHKNTITKLNKPPRMTNIEVAENVDVETYVKKRKKRNKKKKNTKLCGLKLTLNSDKQNLQSTPEVQCVATNIVTKPTLPPSTVSRSSGEPIIISSKKKKNKIDDMNVVKSNKVTKNTLKKHGKLQALIAKDSAQKSSKSSLANFLSFLST